MIEFNTKYHVVFAEWKDTKETPLSNYFFTPTDLSINFLIKNTWAEWAFCFLKLLSWNLSTTNELKDWIELSDCLNNIDLSRKPHPIYLDNTQLWEEQDFYTQMEKNSETLKLFFKSFDVELKMKLNLEEYVLLTSFYHIHFIEADQELIPQTKLTGGRVIEVN